MDGWMDGGWMKGWMECRKTLKLGIIFYMPKQRQKEKNISKKKMKIIWGFFFSIKNKYPG